MDGNEDVEILMKKERLLYLAEQNETKKYLGVELTTLEILEMTAESIVQYYDAYETQLKYRLFKLFLALLRRIIRRLACIKN